MVYPNDKRVNYQETKFVHFALSEMAISASIGELRGAKSNIKLQIRSYVMVFMPN